MAYDRFLIAPFSEDSGLTTNLRPWQIPDQAWAVMDNAYVFRGRIRKRFGTRYLGNNSLNSRLRVQVGTIGSPTSPVTGNGTFWGNLGQMFSAGTQLFTVYQTGTPAAMLATGPGTGTYNTTTGAFALAGTGLGNATPIYWYPALPVMGFAQFEYAVQNSFPSLAFDPQFAYIYTGSAWALSSGSPTWNGSDDNFFWSYNWTGPNAAANGLTRALFTTNFQVTNPNGLGVVTDDPIYFYNGTTWTQYTGSVASGNANKTGFLNPGAGNAPGTGPFLLTALMIVSFHGRLIALNTIENDGTVSGPAPYGNNINYVNRARTTNIGVGSSEITSAFNVNAWYPYGAADNAGNKGINAKTYDAVTSEAIVSAEFIKDRLIVYFEQSTWELVYTGNDQDPFRWQKLNTELGSMATFSTIAFDKAVLTIGETGIHSCNGSNVIRIDQKIPDEIFDISNASTEIVRICGIRDYYNELVYWSVPADDQLSTQYFPTRVLVYNYQNETWSFNDDTITAFGYFDGNPGLTWATITGTWSEWTTPWNSGTTAIDVRQIVAGNQEGFTFLVESESEVSTRDVGVLQITQMQTTSYGIQATVYNHMLSGGDYVYMENAQGVVLEGFAIYEVIYIDANTIGLTYPAQVFEAYGYLPTYTGSYLGGGTLARVPNYNLQSKQWNPYDKDGSNVYVAKIDFAVIKTDQLGYVTPGGNYTVGGAVTVDYSPSSTPLSTVKDATASGAITGTGVLETTPYDPDTISIRADPESVMAPGLFPK